MKKLAAIILCGCILVGAQVPYWAATNKLEVVGDKDEVTVNFEYGNSCGHLHLAVDVHEEHYQTGDTQTTHLENRAFGSSTRVSVAKEAYVGYDILEVDVQGYNGGTLVAQLLNVAP